MESPIQICVVDDHPIIAEGLRRVLDATSDIVCHSVASNAAELEKILRNSQIDVVVLDVRLGQINGIDVCRFVKRKHPSTRVLMLSSFGDQAVGKKAIAAGASGLAVKSISLDMLPAAIRTVHAGGIFFSSEVFMDAMGPGAVAGPAGSGLTTREREIVKMVSDGMGNKEIARMLGLSPHTVKLHISRLLARYHYRSRSQLSQVADLAD